MRSANDNYNVKTKSMLNGNQEVSNFHQNNNYGSFKSVNGPNATVGNADLKGIGQIAADLNQSQENEKFVRGMTSNTNQNNNSHQAAHRKIESSFNANSYINNSSVAKTSMQKRRNISFGGAGNNNYIDQRSTGLVDLEGTVSGGHNRVSRPSINNTFDTFESSTATNP